MLFDAICRQLPHCDARDLPTHQRTPPAGIFFDSTGHVADDSDANGYWAGIKRPLFGHTSSLITANERRCLPKATLPTTLPATLRQPTDSIIGAPKQDSDISRAAHCQCENDERTGSQRIRCQPDAKERLKAVTAATVIVWGPLKGQTITMRRAAPERRSKQTRPATPDSTTSKESSATYPELFFGGGGTLLVIAAAGAVAAGAGFVASAGGF